MEILLAYIKRWFYLLFYGMWKGECGYTEWVCGNLSVIGTIKGNLETGEIIKIFYKR